MGLLGKDYEHDHSNQNGLKSLNDYDWTLFHDHEITMNQSQGWEVPPGIYRAPSSRSKVCRKRPTPRTCSKAWGEPSGVSVSPLPRPRVRRVFRPELGTHGGSPFLLSPSDLGRFHIYFFFGAYVGQREPLPGPVWIDWSSSRTGIWRGRRRALGGSILVHTLWSFPE